MCAKYKLGDESNPIFVDLEEVITDFEVLNVAHNQGDVGNLKGDKTRDSEKLLDYRNHTIWFRYRQSAAVSTTTYVAISLGGLFSNARGIALYYSNEDLRIYASDGSNNGSGTLVEDCDTNILPLDYVDVFIQKDRKEKTVIAGVYNPAGELVGTEVEIDISSFTLDDSENYQYFHLASYRASISSLLVTSDLRSLADCRNITSIVGLQLYYPSVITGIDVAGDNLHLNYTNIASQEKTAYVKDNEYINTYGYVIYERSSAGYTAFHFPIGMDGNEIDPSNLFAVSSNYERIRRVDPTDKHPLYDSKIRFSNAIFDRSDTNIWNADSRASFYYDAADPFAFHISEINQRTMYEYLNDGYRGRIFIKGESNDYLGDRGGSIEAYYRTAIDRVLVYSVDKKGAENYSILEYTGDAFAVATEDDGSITLDGDGYPAIGYFQMTKPIFSIRFDDGFEDQVNEWKTFLDSRGMVAYITVLTGTGDIGNWWYYNAANGITFADLDALVADGWEVSAHGVDNTDLKDKAEKNQDSDISYSINKLRSLGHPCLHYTPHGYAGEDLHVRNYAMRNCFSIHTGYTVAYEGANPKILILNNLSNVRGDISGDFNIDNPTGIQNVKDEIDVAVADDRLLMIFLHEWSQDHENGLDEILDYVEANNVEVTTLSGALFDNARYLPKP